MKLVISFDEFQKPFGQIDPNLDANAQYMEAMTDFLIDYLEYQFPEWDIDVALNVEKADWDFENSEIHIPFMPL